MRVLIARDASAHMARKVRGEHLGKHGGRVETKRRMCCGPGQETKETHTALPCEQVERAVRVADGLGKEPLRGFEVCSENERKTSATDRIYPHPRLKR